MADELDFTVSLPGTPSDTRVAWRGAPPAWVPEHGYELRDESYESLVYEAQVMGAGMRILMWGQAKTLYRITATFRPGETPGETRVTLLGQAKPEARDAILAWSQAAGGP
jgi:hypothetical protein